MSRTAPTASAGPSELLPPTSLVVTWSRKKKPQKLAFYKRYSASYITMYIWAARMIAYAGPQLRAVLRAALVCSK
jgi:hypothetical protein